MNPDVVSDPWAGYRTSEIAGRRAGRVLCGFHSRHPDVGDDYDDPDLADYCPDCDIEAAHEAMAERGPDLDVSDDGEVAW